MTDGVRAAEPHAHPGTPLTPTRMVVDRLPERIDVMPGEIDLVMMYLTKCLADLWPEVSGR